jgi:hypothetical protein
VETKVIKNNRFVIIKLYENGKYYKSDPYPTLVDTRPVFQYKDCFGLEKVSIL